MNKQEHYFIMETNKKAHNCCKNFDTFKCMLRNYKLMNMIKLFCELLHTSMVTVDEYLKVKGKCDKVCAGCDIFETIETD